MCRAEGNTQLDEMADASKDPLSDKELEKYKKLKLKVKNGSANAEQVAKFEALKARKRGSNNDMNAPPPPMVRAETIVASTVEVTAAISSLRGWVSDRR